MQKFILGMLLLVLLASYSEAAPRQLTPYVHSALVTPNEVYTLWAFNTFNPKCPKFYMLVVATKKTRILLRRKLQSCTEILLMKTDNVKLMISIPTNDSSYRTFVYTYTYDIKTREWTDPNAF